MKISIGKIKMSFLLGSDANVKSRSVQDIKTYLRPDQSLKQRYR